jgi:hypothetical protein
MHNTLPEHSRLLAEQEYARLDSLLRLHFARFSTEIIGLAALCLGAAMVLSLIVVAALRV